MRRVGLGVLGAVLVLLALPLVHLAVVEHAGPVVVLTSFDQRGSPHTTHLWSVEVEGARYLAAGADGAAWLARVRAHPEVEVGPEGDPPEPLRAVPAPEMREPVLAAMRARYGFGDRWVRALVGRDAVPVRLEPR